MQRSGARGSASLRSRLGLVLLKAGEQNVDLLKAVNLSESRILIVDDQTDNLKVLAAVLGLAGYTNVHSLSDSRQILQVFQDFQPDAILLDLHMPHVDGLEALDQLATVIAEDDYLPVLVLTGDATS